MICIRTLLLCQLCRKPYDVELTAYDGTDLDSGVRFWCRHCTKPRVFAKMLKRRLAQIEATDSAEWIVLQSLLAWESEKEAARAESLERPAGAVRVAA